MDLNHASVGWAPASAAGALSSFSAILAALVFGGIIMVLSMPARGDWTADRSRPLAVLTGAFFSLAVSAFLFAAISGETPATVRHAYVEAIYPSAMLSVGVIQVSVSLVWLFEVYEIHTFRESPVSGIRFLVHGTVLLVAVLLAGMISSPYYVGIATSRFPPIWEWAVVAIVLALPVPARMLLRHVSLPDAALRPLLIACVGLGIVSAAAEAFAGTMSDDAVHGLYSDPVRVAVLAAGVVVLALFFAAMEFAVDFAPPGLTPEAKPRAKAPRSASA